jgi:diguanylate cyclase (GGDEF)-like protein
MKILIIEDDELTAQALATVLTAHHYAVEVAKDGRSGLALLDSFEYDLLILDVGLPDLDGIQVCRQIRTPARIAEESATGLLPILLLTAHESPHDRALGLDAGADDYVIKPFDEEELVARIRALLRRASAAPTPCLEWGDLQLNPSVCEVTYRSAILTLTPKEYGLLELFLRNSRRVFSCSHILEHLWAYDAPGEEAVRTHIKGLRHKLKAAGAPPDFIETVYGIGYRLKPIKRAVTPTAETANSSFAHSTVTHSTAANSTAANSTVANSTAANSTAANSTVAHSTVTHSTVAHSTTAHSTVAHSTAANSTLVSSTEQELRAKLATIWTQSKERVNEQIEMIDRVLCQADLTYQEQAFRQAHNLAGALGTFGFWEGSKVAKQVEQLLAESPLPPKSLYRLPELTAALRRAIDMPRTTVHPICAEPSLPMADPKPHQKPGLLVVSRDRPLTAALEKEALLWNYQTAIAITAKAVTKICENDTPNLVLLDLDCFDSVDQGLALLSTVQHSQPPIPVIVLTARSELTERLEVSRRGGRLLLQKAIPVAQMFEAIAQVLQRVGPSQAKILIVDDDGVLLEALTTLLKPWGLQVFTLADPQQFWETLEAVRPDVLVLDVEFPNFNGIELCQVVRNDLLWHHLPIIVLTAHSEPAIISQVFAAGADDFVSKPIAGAELVVRLLSRLERAKLLRHLLETDALTGVMNRQKSTQELEAFLHLSARSHQSVAIAVVDVDHLHAINAQYGHAAGDAVLQQFGHLLRQWFCSQDVVARWGGEEFVIGMYGMTRDEGVQRLNHVLQQLQQQALMVEAERPLQITFSAGVAQYPDDGQDLRTLYRAADSALCHAKDCRTGTARGLPIQAISAPAANPSQPAILDIPHPIVPNPNG